MTTIPLSRLTVGQKGEVVDLSGQDDICLRLLEMGLTRGSLVEVVRFAPMGDPLDIKIRGYHLSLRRQEADIVQVHVAESGKNI